MKHFFYALFTLFLFIPLALADEANLGGSGTTAEPLEVVESDSIEMVEETIEMNVRSIERERYDYSTEPVEIDVEVNYTFKNTTSKRVEVKMGFPEPCSFCNGYEREKLNDFKAYENEKEIEVNFLEGQYDEESYTQTNWHVSQIVFEPFEEKEIKNTYWIVPSGYKEGQTWFDYILETGASWEGVIGRVEVYINFPDEISVYDVKGLNPSGAVVDPEKNQIRWSLEDLEPTEEDNITVRLINKTESWRFFCEHRELEKQASSYLDENDVDILPHYPCNASDHDTTTAWVESVQGPGIGEWVEVQNNLRIGPNVQFLRVFNGYGESEPLWKDNNRIKTFKITFYKKDQGVHGEFLETRQQIYEQTLTLKDVYAYQTIDLENSISGADVVRIEILEVYPGAQFDDTALSEIDFLAYPQGATLARDVIQAEVETDSASIEPEVIVEEPIRFPWEILFFLIVVNFSF